MDIFPYLSPFIAAFLASFLTYFFTVRAKKHEIVATQRLEAFKAIQKVLLRFRKYYYARIGDHDWSDFAIGTDSLAEEECISPLEQLEMLDSVLADNEVFLPKKSRGLFDELNTKLSLLCSSELYVATQTDPLEIIKGQESQLEQFQGALTSIEQCIDDLYQNLKLPR